MVNVVRNTLMSPKLTCQMDVQTLHKLQHAMNICTVLETHMHGVRSSQDTQASTLTCRRCLTMPVNCALQYLYSSRAGGIDAAVFGVSMV